MTSWKVRRRGLKSVCASKVIDAALQHAPQTRRISPVTARFPQQ
jgi:hypothetical protein